MNRFILLSIILMCSVLNGCSNQKATGTQQRWTEIQTATNDLKESLYLSQMSEYKKRTQPETVQSDYLSAARATIDACQRFHDAFKAQKGVNVDQRLNAIVEKLQDSSDSLLSQIKLGLEKLAIAQQLNEELIRCQDAQNRQKIVIMRDNVLKDTQSIQVAGATVLQQIGCHYQELETLRPILNKEYGFELPQIKWIGQ